MGDENETIDNRIFGDHTLAGDKGDFFERPLEEQVRLMGWSHACPSIDNVVKEYGDEWAQKHQNATSQEVHKVGLERTLARYAECNFMFGLIAEAAKDSNHDLYELLTKPVDRLLPDEPDGKHSDKYIPPSHLKQMSPLSTPWGYALPRVLIEERGRPDLLEDPTEKTPEKMMKVLQLIDTIVPQCKTPAQLVVRLSEAVAKDEADPKMLLYHLLSAGIYKEENCETLFKEIISEMEESAPTLSTLYKSLNSKERKDLSIVDF